MFDLRVPTLATGPLEPRLDKAITVQLDWQLGVRVEPKRQLAHFFSATVDCRQFSFRQAPTNIEVNREGKQVVRVARDGN